jgi:hypothetical protein
MGHCQFPEMSVSFGISLEQRIYFGGYPGAVSFIENEELWKSYIRDSLIETILSKDVLQIQNIAKPALLPICLCSRRCTLHTYSPIIKCLGSL